MSVVFSTYHSIQAVADAQKVGLPDFDLIICDEAHRTTGVTLSGQDESYFVKIHDAEFIKGKKRLYMTATPRLYGDDAKTKTAEANAELCSMDDPALFGEELHRLGFGQAVGADLLSDYKVLVLAVDEKYVNKTFQRHPAQPTPRLAQSPRRARPLPHPLQCPLPFRRRGRADARCRHLPQPAQLHRRCRPVRRPRYSE